MKIPQTVNILGQSVSIEFLKDSKKLNFVGRCFPNGNKIQLVQDLPDDKLFQTYLHEVLHMIVENTHIKIKHRDLDTLSVALFQFLKENGYL